MAANYLSLLMSSVNVSTSDDSDITNTHSTGQVDYLSHEWREEDVWHSWRRMTRHKNEIANGIRLENASWRTWWKQRNGLQTVNPETLNWLKDSDVTWLYGPLHTADDIKTADMLSSAAASGNPTRSSTPPPPPSTRIVDVLNPKPILKHRTVTELLTSALPPPGSTTGLIDVTSLDGHVMSSSQSPSIQQDGSVLSSTSDPSSSSVKRPALLHTRSETSILGHSPFRKDSPPRIIASDNDNSKSSRSFADNSDHHARQHSPSSSSTTPHNQDPSCPKKHITFNTFVEQCIAIDKPNPYPESTTSSVSFQSSHDTSPATSPIHQRGPYEYVHYSPRPSYQQAWRTSRGLDNDSNEDEEDEDEDEDVRIEVKTRSRSSSFVSRPSSTKVERCNSNGSNNRERFTIATIAPTILKTSSHSHSNSPANSTVSLSNPRSRGGTFCRPHASDPGRSNSDDEDSDEEGDVPLLWVPPVGSGYELDDMDEITNVPYHAARIQAERDDHRRRPWVVTPPAGEALNDSEDAQDGRQGRFSRQRSDGKRRGRDPRSNKLGGSLSPAEVTTSNTDSSESQSRSRSRNRTNLLPPRSGSRSRSRSSSIEQKRCNNTSPSGSGRVITSDADDRQTERGRPLVRKCDSDGDMRGNDKALRGSHIGRGVNGSQRAHTEAPPPATSRGYGGTSSDRSASDLQGGVDKSPSQASTSTTTSAPQTGIARSESGTLSGIRGYIGGIWS